MHVKAKGDKVFQLNASAYHFFIKEPGLDACLQEPVDPDPEIIFQGDVDGSCIILENQEIAIPPDPF